MPRYLNASALVAVRQLAAERAPWRRPRRASRVRLFAPQPGHHPGPGLDVLAAVLEGLRRLEAAR